LFFCLQENGTPGYSKLLNPDSELPFLLAAPGYGAFIRGQQVMVNLPEERTVERTMERIETEGRIVERIAERTVGTPAQVLQHGPGLTLGSLHPAAGSHGPAAEPGRRWWHG